MACVIAVSDNTTDEWWINNRSGWIFFDDILAKYVDPRSALANQIEIASTFHGVALHDLRDENPELAKALARVICKAATDISEGTIDVREFYKFKSEEEQRLFQSRFQQLALMLLNWEESCRTD